MGLKYSNWRSMTEYDFSQLQQSKIYPTSTYSDGHLRGCSLLEPRGMRWRHPSTSKPQVTQRVNRCDPSWGDGTSVLGSNSACVVTVFPGPRENSIVTPLNFRTLEALVEEGEPERVGVVSWRQRHPTITLGSCYPHFQLQPAMLGTRRGTKPALCEILKVSPKSC